jgi:starch phosphorylase
METWDMDSVQLFNVAPAMPDQLSFLETLAKNMWWCWHAESIDLFRRINSELWHESGQNPLDFLNRVPQDRLEALASNDGFLKHLAEVRDLFEGEMGEGDGSRNDPGEKCIAYFSLEFGIHESVRLYSGGLGVLAGDHLKAASDLALPLVAVGLMYRQGYFQQYLDRDGLQQEYYPDNEIHCLPLSPALDAEGKQILVHVPLPEGKMMAQVWRLNVGRVPLYLLDTNIQDNPVDFRSVTGQLYGGDKKNRLRQEILLGVGGFRALACLGMHPKVCHMNEGHAAFMGLERMAHLVREHELDIDEAMQVVSRSGVFTTHTPVAAGNETFELSLLKPHLEALKGELGIDPERIISWGQAQAGTNGHELSMTILGLRTASFSNGVSDLHGLVARRMWQHLWPGRPHDEIPIGHVTNGIHVPSWLYSDVGVLFDRYLGDSWRLHPSEARSLKNISHIPEEELWRVHELARSRLVRSVRELTEKQLRARNSSRSEISQVKSILDHDALTIGFARRFATYKRGNLLLRDPERLAALLSDDDRPVQFVFAGKAHPADSQGKDFIRQLVHFARRAKVRHRMVFVENYNIGLARYMVQGVDVWLNTPRRPLEASGTSGMKAAVNGVLNLSTLDGWWCEGYGPDCGWVIGDGEEYQDQDYQDAVESQALFNLLENEVIPCFYEREVGELPRKWINMMRSSIRMALNFFTSHRMVEDYNESFYISARDEFDRLMADDAAVTHQLEEQRRRLDELWPKVSCSFPVTDHDISSLHVGDRFTCTTVVKLGSLNPDEVDVEIYHGPVSSENQIKETHVEQMTMVKNRGHDVYLYQTELECRHTGRFGFSARVTPAGMEWKHSIPGFITWADGQ